MFVSFYLSFAHLKYVNKIKVGTGNSCHYKVKDCHELSPDCKNYCLAFLRRV